MRTAPFSTLLTFLVAFAATSLAQSSPPSQGIQLGDPSSGVDIRFPLTVAQCDTVLIYYSTIIARTNGWHMWIYPPHDISDAVVVLTIPTAGSGYLEWVCDIPAGYGFIIDDDFHSRYYVVQSGTTSCLRDITTIYTYAFYNTSNWRTYTLNSPDVVSPTLLPDPTPVTVSYPVGNFSTLTANPDLVIPSTTSLQFSKSAASATASTSSLPSTNSHTSKTPAIIAGVIGGIAIILIAVFVVLFGTQRRRTSVPGNNHHPIATSQPAAGLMATQTMPSAGWVNPGISPTMLPASGWEPRSDSSSPTSGHRLYVPDHVSTSSSSPIPASMAQWPDSLVSLSNQSTVPPYDPMNPSSGMASWNTVPRTTFAGVQMPQMQSMSSPQSNSVDMRAALDVLARLDPAERLVLTSMLHNMSPQNSPR